METMERYPGISGDIKIAIAKANDAIAVVDNGGAWHLEHARAHLRSAIADLERASRKIDRLQQDRCDRLRAALAAGRGEK